MPGRLVPDPRLVNKDALHCHLLGQSPCPGPITSPAFFGDCSARNATNSGQRGASPKGACRVEYRCAASPHTKVLRGCLGAVSGDQAELPGPCDGLGAVGGPELAQDVCHVLFDRVERHHQFVGDALISADFHVGRSAQLRQ